MDWEPQNMGSIEIHPNLSQARLDRDERDTLALAVGMGSELVLVDEAEARRVARAHGLAVCGSLGILIEAHRRGLLGVDQLRLVFAEIVRRQDIWINPALVERLLRDVLGE